MTEQENLHRRRGPSAPAAEKDGHEAPKQQPYLSYFSWPTILSAIAILCAGFAFVYSKPVDQGLNDTDYVARTERILRTTPLIDGHNDLPYLLRIELQNRIYDKTLFNFSQRKSAIHPSIAFQNRPVPDLVDADIPSHTDLVRMKKGLVGGQFWSVFVECPATDNLDDPTHSVRDTLEQIDVTKRFVNDVDELEYCETSACAMAAFKAGKIPSMLGAEGMHQTGSSIAVIRQLHEMGVRYITITHNCDNPYATAASTVTATGRDAGLTRFGAAAVAEMNRLGMMVDLSHTSHNAMRQVLDITRSPVIFSHSACYALAANYRNAPDDVIERLRENGGGTYCILPGSTDPSPLANIHTHQTSVSEVTLPYPTDRSSRDLSPYRNSPS